MGQRVRVFLTVIMGLLAFTLQGCATSGLPLSWYEKTAAHSLNPKTHQRLASAYHKEAATLRKRAAYHTAMAEKVRANPSWSGPRERDEWLAHCEYLSKKYLEAAEAAEALAEEHEGHAEGLEGLQELLKGW
ncbi:MAG: hypothetical protein HY737_05605 [Candidatus Omnitrophica bacterium]|nr:hypothetical protein [Candidatus Omnitrophota bacterium]